MGKSLNIYEIQRASRLAKRLAGILEGPTGLRQSADTVQVFAQALLEALDGFEHKSLDIEVDRLVALRNLSRNLHEHATQIRQGVASAVYELIDSREDLSRAISSEENYLTEVLIALLRDLTSDEAMDLELISADRRGTGPATAEPTANYTGPVVANSRTHIYHLPGHASYRRLSSKNRIEFPNAESAELAGYRRSRL